MDDSNRLRFTYPCHRVVVSTKTPDLHTLLGRYPASVTRDGIRSSGVLIRPCENADMEENPYQAPPTAELVQKKSRFQSFLRTLFVAMCLAAFVVGIAAVGRSVAIWLQEKRGTSSP